MRYLFILALLISVQGYGQWKNYIIGAKGDTLNRVDQQGRQQGPWVVHVDDLRGERGYEEEGYFENGKKTGTWRKFSLEGDLIAVENYRWGQKDGKCVYLNLNGDPLREESWRAVDPKNPYDTVDVVDPNNPSRIIGKQIIKLEGTTLKNGTWKYYDPFSGRLEKTEQWVFDKLKTKEDDDMAPIAVSDDATDDTKTKAATEKKEKAKPKEVLEFEKKNSGKKKIRVRDGATGG
jgi:antitoxin component YwqK of YwqJK toxin-antitoxin module